MMSGPIACSPRIVGPDSFIRASLVGSRIGIGQPDLGDPDLGDPGIGDPGIGRLTGAGVDRGSTDPGGY
jgi:hypothetical protein